MAGGWVYIVTNKPNGTLYVGVTSDLSRRAWEHRQGMVEGFTKRYGLKRLVVGEGRTFTTSWSDRWIAGTSPAMTLKFGREPRRAPPARAARQCRRRRRSCRNRAPN